MTLIYVVIIGLLIIVVVYLMINKKPEKDNDSNNSNNNIEPVIEPEEDGLSATMGGQALKEKVKNASLSNPLIIMVYMNGCGWCEKMKPEFDKANKSNPNVDMAMINAEDILPLIKKLDVSGFPTIFKCYGPGMYKEPESGFKDLNSINNYINK